jgi:hypothetical protein
VTKYVTREDNTTWHTLEFNNNKLLPSFVNTLLRTRVISNYLDVKVKMQFTSLIITFLAALAAAAPAPAAPLNAVARDAEPQFVGDCPGCGN